MPGLNKVQLIGRLGKEPEQRKTPKGRAVTSFSLAVDRAWKSKGETKKGTDWFNVDAWGKLGEICQKYLQKGQLVYVEGALRTDKYEQDGETKYFTKVIARSDADAGMERQGGRAGSGGRRRNRRRGRRL